MLKRCKYEVNQRRQECANVKYLSIAQTAEKWGISARRIQILCNEDRIPGAMRIGYVWAIPADAEKPADARVKSGKYIKAKPENEDKSE